MLVKNTQANKQSRKARRQCINQILFLPIDYTLTDHDVICGRGGRCFNYIGDIQFRKIVQSQLRRYSLTKSRLEKTIIITEIVNHIRKLSPNGGFVKSDSLTGRYYEVGDYVAVST